jgi:hypothetical protein
LGDIEVEKQTFFVFELLREANPISDIEKRICHEVSLPITPRSIRFGRANDILEAVYSYAAVSTARMRGETSYSRRYQIQAPLEMDENTIGFVLHRLSSVSRSHENFLFDPEQ